MFWLKFLQSVEHFWLCKPCMLEPVAGAWVVLIKTLQQWALGRPSTSGAARASGNRNISRHSTNFVSFGNSYFAVESGTAERVTARRSSEATRSLARSPAAAASGFASLDPPGSANPPLVGQIGACLLDLELEELGFRLGLQSVAERSLLQLLNRS
jgi:hypothetical protein